MSLEEISTYLSAKTFLPLTDTRPQAVVKCPLCCSMSSRAEAEGEICMTCELCPLGEEVLGLNLKIDKPNIINHIIEIKNF